MTGEIWQINVDKQKERVIEIKPSQRWGICMIYTAENYNIFSKTLNESFKGHNRSIKTVL